MNGLIIKRSAQAAYVQIDFHPYHPDSLFSPVPINDWIIRQPIITDPHVAGTPPALRARRLNLGVVTDAYNGNALKRLRKAGLEEYFDAIITMDMSGKAKPSPEPFLLGMKMPGVTAKETMLVGDSIRRDIVPAKALGMLAVHAVYGDRNFHEGERDGAF